MATEQTSRLEARLPASVYATLKRAAELKGRSLTDFVVSAAHDAAQRAIEEESIIRLSAEGAPAAVPVEWPGQTPVAP